jgi:ABC-type branched-subunit amino acid transport system substrate-binding protein
MKIHNIIPGIFRLSIPLTLAALLLLSFGIVAANSAKASPTSGTTTAHPVSPLSNGGVITLGVAAGTSGPAEFLGWPQVNAAQLAVDQVNAAGGVTLGGSPY